MDPMGYSYGHFLSTNIYTIYIYILGYQYQWWMLLGSPRLRGRSPGKTMVGSTEILMFKDVRNPCSPTSSITIEVLQFLRCWYSLPMFLLVREYPHASNGSPVPHSRRSSTPVIRRMIYLSGVKSVDSMALVDTLHSKLTMHATVFLDSCYAGINGIAAAWWQIDRSISLHPLSCWDLARFGFWGWMTRTHILCSDPSTYA
jgi:hypothetical protein